MPRANLIIVRAGDTSLHPQWLTSADRSWDIVVSYFGNHPGRYYGQYDMLHLYRGSKWHGIHDFVQRYADLLTGYEYIWLPDDDLLTTSEAIDEFFACCRDLNLTAAQPSLTGYSHHTWPITLQRPGLQARITNFVEIMAPCFRGDTFTLFSDRFAENSSGYGYEFFWYRLAQQHGIDNFGIIDRTPFHHWRAIGFRDVGATENPLEEQRQLFARHGLEAFEPAVLREIPERQTPEVVRR